MRLPEDYHWTTQEGSRIPMSDRADLIGWMYAFARFHDLTLDMLRHIVNYITLFMSSNKIISGHPYLLGC
jgi:cyclin-A